MTITTSLILDADMILYRAASAAQQEVEWEPWMWTITSDLQDVFRLFNEDVEGKRAQADASHVHLAFTDLANFRQGLDATYKSGRSKKPVGYRAAYDHLLGEKTPHRTSWVRHGLEGDDIIGILATRPTEGRRVIWSGDKDMKQIPGEHLQDDGSISSITEIEADHFHAMQTLTGDVTDGYAGCPTMGPIKASKLLGSVPQEQWWTAIEAAYAKQGLDRDYMLTQARLARILRFTDYNMQTKEPILWQPPSVAI